MNYRFFAIASLLLLFSFTPLLAEGDDVVQENHFYIEASGGCTLPLGFFSTQLQYTPLMSYGADASFGFGFNFGGFMFGLEIDRDMWWQSADEHDLMINFNNNMALLKLQVVLSQSKWGFLPRWLEIVPGLGVGVNFANAQFYTSTRAKADGTITTVPIFDMNGFSVAVKASLEFSLWFGVDWVIPYFGADYTLLFDSLSAISFPAFGRAFAGVRIYPGSIAHAVKYGYDARAKQEVNRWGIGQTSVGLSQQDNFVPSQGKNGALEISPRYQYLEFKPQSWSVEIIDASGKTCASWNGTDSVPKKILWDGTISDGSPLLSMQNYTVRCIIIPQAADRERNGQQMLGTQSTIKTGIVELEQSIYIDSIVFDSDLTQSEQKANDAVYDALAKAVKARSDTTVTIYGKTLRQAQTVRQELIARGCTEANLTARASSSLPSAIRVDLNK